MSPARAGLAVSVVLLLGACRHPAALPAPVDPSFVLPAPESLEPDFSVRQHVTVESHGQSGSFDAVLQKKGGELVMVGLVAGVRAFVLKQTAAGITYEQSFGPKLPFAASNVIVDVYRVYFWRLPHPPGERLEGTLNGHLEGEDVEEVWAGGSLTERRFFPAGGRTGVVRVTFGEGCTAGRCAPSRVRIANERLAYTISIDSEGYEFF